MNNLSNTHSRWTQEEEATFARLRAEMHSPEGQATFARLRAGMHSPEGQATFARLRAEMQAQKINAGNEPSMLPEEEAAPVMKSPEREIEISESADFTSSSSSEVNEADESSVTPTGLIDQHAVQAAQQAAQQALDVSRQALELSNQALQMHMDMANQAMQLFQMQTIHHF